MAHSYNKRWRSVRVVGIQHKTTQLGTGISIDTFVVLSQRVQVTVKYLEGFIQRDANSFVIDTGTYLKPSGNFEASTLIHAYVNTARANDVESFVRYSGIVYSRAFGFGLSEAEVVQGHARVAGEFLSGVLVPYMNDWVDTQRIRP